MTEWLDLVGAMHVHSRYSDGTGHVPEILDAAREAGLDFLVMSDHDTLALKREGWEGMHDGVALLAAVEATPRRQGHIVGMKVRSCMGYAAQKNSATLDDMMRQGGFAVIAHPLGKHKISLGILHEPYEEWSHPAVRGLEIWSYTHDWVDAVEPWRIPRAHALWKHPERCVQGPYATVLKTWDRLGKMRRYAGLAGLDCHARIVPLTSEEIFPYESMFRWLRNHVRVRRADWERDPVAALWDALAEGRGFIAHDILADAKGSKCGALLPDGRMMEMGEEAEFMDGTVMTIALPRAAEVSWVADGDVRLAEKTARMAARPAGPGVYRFEARIEGRPWLFTNPFYLR